MLSRREDGLQRIPSPSPSRRHIRSRDDPYGTTAECRSGGYRKAPPSREPSPGGMGRLSTSAPAGWDPPSLQDALFSLNPAANSREAGGYYGRELQIPVRDGQFANMRSTFNKAASSFSSSSVAAVSSAALRNQATPKANGHVSHLRPASASAMAYGGYYVNGDSMPSAGPRWTPAASSGRPQSFPPTQPTPSAAPVIQQYGWRATGCGKANSNSGLTSSALRPTPGSPAHRREEQRSSAMPSGATGLRPESPLPLGQPPRSGVVGGSAAAATSCSPTGRRSNGGAHLERGVSPVSDEALSSITRTEARALKDAERLMAGYQEGSFTSDDGYTWHSALTCYLCGQLFRRPRILPCGHTFCSDCLAQLKDELLREGRRMPGGPHAVCTWSPPAGKVDPGAGLQFVCPMPDCHYAMRLMNLTRWSTRNKAVTAAVSALRKMYEDRQDASTQTDITLESVLVTIPRSLIQDTPASCGGAPDERGRRLVRRHSGTLADRMVQRALSMDCLSRSYIPQPHAGWRSYVAMLGMHILQQIIHT